jgi:hypothetical protein
MAVRLTKEGLRRLIVSEARRLQYDEYDPGWEDLVSTCAGAAGEAFKEANPYEDGDGMGEERGGASAWDQQVEDAAQALTEELMEIIAPVVHDVQRRLDEGEFWKG